MANPCPDEGVRAALEAFLDQGESRDEIKCHYCGDSHAGNNCRVTGGHDFDATGGTVWEFSGEAVEALRAALSTPVPEEGLRGSASAAEIKPAMATWREDFENAPRNGRSIIGVCPNLPGMVWLEWCKINGVEGWYWGEKLYHPTAYFVVPVPDAEPGAGAASALPLQRKPVTYRWRIIDGYGNASSWFPEGSPNEHFWRNSQIERQDLYTAEALAAERARAGSLKTYLDEAVAQLKSHIATSEKASAFIRRQKEALDEANARLADLAKPEEQREWLPSTTIDRLQARAEAAEALAARAAEDERDRLYAKAEGWMSPGFLNWLRDEGAMLPDDRAALRARNILKETPHGER